MLILIIPKSLCTYFWFFRSEKWNLRLFKTKRRHWTSSLSSGICLVLLSSLPFDSLWNSHKIGSVLFCCVLHPQFDISVSTFGEISENSSICLGNYVFDLLPSSFYFHLEVIQWSHCYDVTLLKFEFIFRWVLEFRKPILQVRVL